jgi:hypothetical protein
MGQTVTMRAYVPLKLMMLLLMMLLLMMPMKGCTGTQRG